MIAYETLWAMPGQSPKTIAELFRRYGTLPSRLLEILSRESLFPDLDLREKVALYLANHNGFSVCVNGAFDYPNRLREARYPIELFYYRGYIGFLEARCISVVGTRKCTREGQRCARDISRALVKEGFTVVSGLAAGIDTAAMKAAISAGGHTIGVIGTPLNAVYPPENEALQEEVAQHHLLISQVPFYRYSHESFKVRRLHFPYRNETMAALSEATVIIQASTGSGTLTQARACLHQRRRLFIHDLCFEKADATWPAYYIKRGAIRISSAQELLKILKEQSRL